MISYATTFLHERPNYVGGTQYDTSMKPYKDKEMWYDCLCDNFSAETN